MAKQMRDSKDPMPNANNSFRSGENGNSPVEGNQEGHGAAKAERVKEGQRYTLRTGGESQPTRQNEGGNVPVTGESHDQKKAERISADRRF